ncbi:transcriptional regulator [Enterococcus rivorum]|uniref:Transcriptional regulator n=1 Tax=Enterococcus rivorum TaxID=762845 RepID=A0A1E5L0J8_9ENTE|nr:transcriptional regulator [Enterococcus rivorum]MBP2098877.1 hypothetical protein [Enterococcus rivorum]OEH83604.1 transcriptional regulator [Enterococcus rivorum]
MARESYDQWKVPKSQFNQSMTYYVKCDCGDLAKLTFYSGPFECPTCHKKYIQRRGQYVEMK